MMHFNAYLSKWDWDIECFVTSDDLQLNKIMCKLGDIGCSDALLVKAYDIMSEQYNSGFAYSSPKYRKSIMVINMATSMEEFVNTYNHEKNHIEMHICDSLEIDPYSEEAADLSGELAEILFISLINNIQ